MKAKIVDTLQFLQKETNMSHECAKFWHIIST